MDFEELLFAVNADTPERLVRLKESTILCFDPGHTTGWAVFKGAALADSGEIGTHSIEEVLENAYPLIDEHEPWVVVMEDYRVYKWRAKHHVGSELLTVQVIGAIAMLCTQLQVNDLIKQPAHVAKGFCTDKKLKEWGYHQPGMRHARDAIRHGCYYHLFGAVQKKDKIGSTVG